MYSLIKLILTIAVSLNMEHQFSYRAI